MIKKWKKLEENCIFLFFGKFLEHWKQKWWKMIKTWKKNEKNWGKIAIFHFLENCNFPRVCFSFFFIFFHFFIIFHHFSSIPPLEAKMKKKWLKKWKKLEENCIFFIFRKFFGALEAKMMKNDKKMKKNEKNEKNYGKIAIFHFLENCNFPRVCFSFFFHFFIIFFSFFIIFHHFSSIPPLEAKMIKKW